MRLNSTIVIGGLISIVAFSLYACALLEDDQDAMLETALRHLLEGPAVSADSLIVDVDGDEPSDELLDRLRDLDVYLTTRSAVGEPDEDADHRFSHLSVRRLQRPRAMDTNWGWWLHSVIVEVSVFSPPYDAYGVEYRLQRVDGEWKVVEQGVEWMT